VAKNRPGRKSRLAGARRRPASPVVPLDAEDIAMARLQAQLRRTEAIRAPGGRGASALSRTTLRLPREMLRKVRDRARQEGTTISQVMEMALERYLKPS
jgi:hypothetical protein